MKNTSRAVFTLVLFSSLITAAAAETGIATAAAKSGQPKRSFDSCRELALQRGFTPGSHGAMKSFMIACMRGTQS